MTKPTTPTSTDRPIVRVPHSFYQPTAQELREDLRLQGQFEDAVKALVRPVRVRQVMPPKPDRAAWAGPSVAVNGEQVRIEPKAL